MCALCSGCGLDMETAPGCRISQVRLENGKVFARILVDTTPCPDCGAQRGNFHHENCDQEKCPACGGQNISCECEGEGTMPIASKKAGRLRIWK